MMLDAMTAPQPIVPSFPREKGSPRIVGIGASAGGLEPMERFLARIPSDTGMAFIVVQHMDPASPGFLVEILQRVTTMPVRQVTDRMRVAANTIYVPLPGRYLAVLHGVLHLFAPPEAVSLRLPVDFFFRSLAEDRREHGIAVVLSGTGYDGTLGTRAVKEKGGLILVQDPAGARYSSMPRSVIEARAADIVAAPEELGERICNVTSRRRWRAPGAERVAKSLDKVIILLRSQTGHDFSSYKRATLCRRLERRMAIHRLESGADYLRFLQQSSQELELLFREFLIGVTGFFRDPGAWEVLERSVIPGLLARCCNGETLRVWSAGCSTGEEAYSLAIAFYEAWIRQAGPLPHRIHIFATDLDPKAIEHARQGLFPASIAGEIAPERLARHFTREGEYFRIAKVIREMITFAPHNVIAEPPFLRLDLLVCRNLLIYLEGERQKKVFPLFHYALKPDGFLFLGQAESPAPRCPYFNPVGSATSIFRRAEAEYETPLEFPAMPTVLLRGKEPVSGPKPGLQTLAEQLLLQLTPPAVLTRANGDIVYLSGKVGPFLEFASGKANLNLFAMIRDELRPPLASGIARAGRERGVVTLSGIKLPGDGGGRQLDLRVERLEHPELLRDLLLVVFAERPAAEPRGEAAPDPGRLAEVEEELVQTREALRLAQEEMRKSREELLAMNEELQSANEELLSTNEELQSANEELGNAKEQTHLMVGELERVNLEQAECLRESVAARGELAHLLEHCGVPIIHLDRECRVRRYSGRATALFKLIPGDVGRPLADLAGLLCYDRLTEDAQTVLRTGVPVETCQLASDGRRFAVRISFLPGRKEGVVVSFHEVTALVLAQLVSGGNDRPTGGADSTH